MNVRIAHIDDLAMLVTLRCALWPDVDIGEHEQLVRQRFQRGARFATMILQGADARACGFVEISSEPVQPGEPGRASLGAVFVAPTARRLGGATQLIDAAQRWARSRGATSFYCDLPIDDEAARDSLQWLGFVEGERWVRAARTIDVPLEVTLPDSALLATGDQPLPLAEPDDLPELIIEKVRSPVALYVNVGLFIVAVVAFANTNIYSSDVVRGVLLPLLDAAFVFYFALLFISMRYRKRADSSARMDQLFRGDDPRK